MSRVLVLPDAQDHFDAIFRCPLLPATTDLSCGRDFIIFHSHFNNSGIDPFITRKARVPFVQDPIIVRSMRSAAGRVARFC